MRTICRFGRVGIAAAVSAALVSAVGAADLPQQPAETKTEAASPTPLFDIAFGAKFLSDYNFRGISQSNRDPAG